jgi:hypothetical protein
VQFEKKEFVVLIAGTLLTFASIAANDPCIFAVCFSLSGLCFLYLCYAHKGRKRKRALTAIFVVLLFWFIGNRAYSSIVKSLSSQNFNPSERPRFSEKFDRITFDVGGNKAILPNVEGMRLVLLELSASGKFGLFRLGGSDINASADTPLVGWIKNHKLYIDAEVFAGAGRSPMHFRNNEVSNKPDGWDTNTDETTALEVVNEQKKPVLQILYSGEARITVKGVFVNGEMVAVVDHGVLLNPARHPLRRLFKYPSDDYHGVFDYSLLRCFDKFRVW